MTEFRNIIGVAELAALLENDACRVIDCRFDLAQPQQGKIDYANGHIPTAVYADLNEDLAGPVSAGSGRHPLPELRRFEQLIASWGVTADTQVVVYDHANGATAARLWWLLRWVGHERVAVLDGGYAAWLRDGGESCNKTPDITPVERHLQANFKMVATTADITAHQSAGAGMTLVDARDAARFAGHVEPIDPVAGHVPGAVNFPFMSLLHENGTWRSLSEIGRVWDSRLQEHGGAVVAMCGSGVTACHILLAAHQLGIEAPRLYVGSWSEWIRDAAHEVVTEP